MPFENELLTQNNAPLPEKTGQAITNKGELLTIYALYRNHTQKTILSPIVSVLCTFDPVKIDILQIFRCSAPSVILSRRAAEYW